VVAATVVLLGVGFGLRVAREAVSPGGVQERTTEGSMVRRLSVVSNHTRYDAALLLFDGESPQPERPGVRVFLDAAQQAVLPFNPPQPVVESPALVVATTYEPRRRNGWPLSALGDWHYAGGMWAVPIGAAFSGALLGLADRFLGSIRADRWVVVAGVSTMLLTMLAWGGYEVMTIVRARNLVAATVAALLAALVLREVTARRTVRVGEKT